MDIKNASRPSVSIPDKKKIVELNKKVSRLRATVYIAIAVLVLFACLSLFWINNYYDTGTQIGFETYFSKAPQKPVAYLYLSPEQGNYKVGEKFIVDILVNTVGSNVNAIAAYLSYDKTKIEAESIDFTGSVFNIPIEQTIDANNGKIKIGIAKPTPGIKAFNGKVASVQFKALSKTPTIVENIHFDFTNGSDLFSGVFLNNKKGTNILGAVRGAKIFIN